VRPFEIRAAIEELRYVTRPEQRTRYERALHALAELVESSVAVNAGLLDALRAAIPSRDPRLDEVSRLRQVLRDLVDFDLGEPPELDALCAIEGPRKLARMQAAWKAAVAEVGPRDQRRHEGDVP